MAICSWISIPWTVPFTLQTFAVFLAAEVLGGKRALISTAVYILLGAVGVPVFSNFGAGVGVLFGVTGGYIIGFLATDIVMWVGERLSKNRWTHIAFSALGLLACYAFGTAWFMAVYIRNGNAITLGSVLTICVVPFIIPDAVKIALAQLVAGRLKKVIKTDE